MRFSYCMLPDYPLADSIDMIQTADELGFHAVYSVDETWHKDWAVLFAAAADKTQRIRFGPNVTHVFLREPTLIVQQLATLDELTNGRMEAVVSTGNFGLMHQYHVDWAARKPLSRLQGGAVRHAHVPRRGQDRLQGRLLRVQRPVHRRAARCRSGCRC